MKNFFFDEYGMRFRTVCVIVFLAIAGLVGGVAGATVVAGYVGGNISCAQTGSQLHLPSNYAFLSDTCYLTLPDGSRVDASNYVGVTGGKH